MKILITGAGGFVGKNLAEGLENKFDILAPVSSELELTDYSAVKKYLSQNKITHVIHTAVHSKPTLGSEERFEKDLRMFLNLTRNLDKLTQLIVFGSGAEFGKTRDIKKVKEEEAEECIPADAYGLSKAIIQQIAKHEPKMLNLRLFGVYGPYEDYRYKFISNAIVKNLLGLPIKIKQDVIFDYLYVTDLVSVITYFLTHKPKYRDYNVTPTKSIKLSKISSIINDVSVKASQIDIVNGGLNYEYTGSNQRLMKEVINYHITDYRSGISRLYAYYQREFAEGHLDRNAVEKDNFILKAITKCK